MKTIVEKICGHFYYYPQKKLKSNPQKKYGINFIDVVIKYNTDEIHGWLLHRKRSNKVILYSHGNAGNISDRLFLLNKLYSNLQVSILIYDYRGYGKSKGEINEKNTYKDSELMWNYLIKMGYKSKK